MKFKGYILLKSAINLLIFNYSRPLANIVLFVLLNILTVPSVIAQDTEESHHPHQDIYRLIDQYNQARENKDTSLLKNILTTDVDQLASSGEWRRGIESAIEGMLRSSNRNPGQRSIIIERIRFLDPLVAIVDTRYEIQLSGTVRSLWSTFIVVRLDGEWKIAAIRNMLPTEQP